MDPVLAKEIQNLIDDNRGDAQRLKFILECIQNEKKIYNTDQKYLVSLLSQYSKDDNILERLDFNLKPEEKIVTFANDTMKPNSGKSSRPTASWYLAPIFMGIVGSFFMWLILKDYTHQDTSKMIRKGWIIGIILTLLSFLPFLLMPGMYLFL